MDDPGAGFNKFTSERPLHCRVCGCIPCIDGTLCEGDKYPMYFVIRREMRDAALADFRASGIKPIRPHVLLNLAPRSPKQRIRKR